MARDFAKRKQANSGSKAAGGRAPGRKAPGGKAPARKNTGQRGKTRSTARPGYSGWRWYGAGVMTGVFLSFLFYLGTLPSPGGLPAEGPGEPEEAAQPPRPRFDFYTLLPEQTIDVEVEVEEEVVAKPRASSASERYLLQAGSFRQRQDADRRRAELLLLGLDPKVEETNGDNGRWYRVYLGPFDSRSKMARARSLTANQDIDTLLLKRNTP